MLLLFSLVCFAIFGLSRLIYSFMVSVYDHWKKRGVPDIPGTFPYGSDPDYTRMTVYQGYLQYEMYMKYSALPYFGIYVMRSPSLVVRSPEIISLILAKEFSHFRDRLSKPINKKNILSRHLFHLKGDEWKSVRSKISPAFTNAKLKMMFPLFIKCAENFETLLLKKYQLPVDVKNTTADFTIDVICNCLFGIEASTPKSEDELKIIAFKSVQANWNARMVGLLKMVLPEIGNLITVRVYDQKLEKFFLKFVSDSMIYREKNNIKRNDFLDYLIQLKNNKIILEEEVAGETEYSVDMDVTLELMAAQCFVFFLAGFETSSSAQSLTLYELAVNPEIQKKLQKEIDEVILNHGGLTYDTIKEMTYLQMVISETMRKYPTVPVLRRACIKPLTLPDGFDIIKGDQLLIPLWSLHHDPEYFPNPDDYIPERFSEENRGSIKPYTYLPFGEGPRSCLGKGFGLLQTKIGLITILKKYNIETTSKTVIPLVLKGPSNSTVAKDPINLRFVPRC